MTPSRKLAVLGVLALALIAPLSACTGDETAPVGRSGGASDSAAPTRPAETKGDHEADGAGAPTEDPAAPESERVEAAAPDAATADVVPFDAPAVQVANDADDGLAVALGDIVRERAEPSMPGEIAGSAIQVDVTVDNTGTDGHDLSASVVNLYYGPERIPARVLSGSGKDNLPALVPAGEKVTGTYVFAVPEDVTQRIQVEIDVDPELQVVLFEGEVSR